MARNLNKGRIRNSRIIIIVVTLFGLFGVSPVSQSALWHEAFEAIGIVLVSICALGRIYTTAFIGGSKNEKLVTTGPYSLCRNPLYCLSLIGATGVGFSSTHPASIILCFFGFLMIYNSLIAREEEFLKGKFGEEFERYIAATPKLFPSFRKYKAPKEVTVQARFMTNALKDSVWWFAPLAVFEAADILRETGVYQPFLPLF